MNRSASWIVGIIIVIVVLGAAWYFSTQPSPGTSNPSAASTPKSGAGTTGEIAGTVGGSVGAGVSAGTPVTVRLTESGFSPSSVTIKKGQTVNWVNETSGSMWVASDEHPSHIEYDGSSRTQHCAAGAPKSFDQCATGSPYSFTFDKAGSFNYHNHSDSSQFGKVVVTE